MRTVIRGGRLTKTSQKPRYDTSLSFKGMFPIRSDGICACGCNRKLTGRRTRWATDECSTEAGQRFAFAKGDVTEIRRRVYERDGGVCVSCGVVCNEHYVRGKKVSRWEADHIIELADGGRHEMSNLQTMCVPCHRGKTKESAERRRRLRKEE